MTLFAIDFDYTITSQHVHNTLVQAIKHDPSLRYDLKRQWNVVSHIAPIGNKSAWQEIVNTLLNNQHKIAIVSFNEFPHIISHYLKVALELPDETLKNIAIIAWLPENPRVADKNTHLEQAIAKLNLAKGDGVVLVDDSEHNIQRARERGYKTILATPQQTDYLDELLFLASQN